MKLPVHALTKLLLKMLWLYFPAIFSILCTLTQAVYYVNPNDSLPLICPGEVCLSLDQYTQQVATYFTTGATFVFLGGFHAPHNPVRLTNISDITLKGEENATDAVILYKNEVFILCERVTNLVIERLKFMPNFKNSSDGSRKVLVLKLSYSAHLLISCSSFIGHDHSGLVISSTRAIHTIHSTLKIVGCLFVENSGDDGGAIQATFRSRITVDSSTFIGNRAGGNGGAIFSSNCTLSFNGNVFVDNRAAANGGAVSVWNTTIYINGSSEDQSSSSKTYATSMKYCDPGYLHGYDTIYGKILMSLSSGVAHFCSNQAGDSGGALYSYSSQLPSVDQVCCLEIILHPAMGEP